MPIETSLINRTSENKSPVAALIMLAVIIGIAGIGAYFFLKKPLKKTDGKISLETQYAAKQIQEETRPKSFGENYEFDDGLRNPVSEQKFQLNEMVQGISKMDIFEFDINTDGMGDKITRTRNENGTAHFYYNYKIELNTGAGFIDITPNGFRTTEGAGCALQKFRFVFIPYFQIIKISRDWQETWDTPTIAQKTIYKIDDNTLHISDTQQLQEICNVSDLF